MSKQRLVYAFVGIILITGWVWLRSVVDEISIVKAVDVVFTIIGASIWEFVNNSIVLTVIAIVLVFNIVNPYLPAFLRRVRELSGMGFTAKLSEAELEKEKSQLVDKLSTQDDSDELEGGENLERFEAAATLIPKGIRKLVLFWDGEDFLIAEFGEEILKAIGLDEVFSENEEEDEEIREFDETYNYGAQSSATLSFFRYFRRYGINAEPQEGDYFKLTLNKDLKQRLLKKESEE